MLDTFKDIFPIMKNKYENFSLENFKVYFIQSLCMYLCEIDNTLNNKDELITELKLIKEINNKVK